MERERRERLSVHSPVSMCQREELHEDELFYTVYTLTDFSLQPVDRNSHARACTNTHAQTHTHPPPIHTHSDRQDDGVCDVIQ